MPLVLNPSSSVCDICRESFLDIAPHTIPCGHVLCASCCTSIIEKTPSRLTPACPFCREHFTIDGVRRIRIDFSASGWSTPPLKSGTVEAHTYVPPLAPPRPAKAPCPIPHEGGSKSRAESRRLEEKVARVAGKKCSVEEVSTLHKELQEWLVTSSTKSDDETSLHLSAALLRAILMNHLAHSDANKAAKATESHLKGKIDDLEIKNAKMDGELSRLKSQYAAKSQESQTLLSELSRLQAKASGLSSPPSRSSSIASQSRDARRQSTSSMGGGPPPPPPSTPVPFSSASSSMQSPLARFSSVHARSVSASHHAPGRSATPAGTSPSFFPPARSSTPVGTSSMPRSRSSSISPPPPMSRSSSDEKRPSHERWYPNRDGRDPGKPYSSASAASRAYPSRYGTPVPAT